MPIMYLDATETQGFYRMVTQLEAQLKTVRDQTDRWQFIDVAVGYLVKAFFPTNWISFFGTLRQ